MSDAVTWPNGARCAAMLTFDFDAETLWLSRDPGNADKLGTLSQGEYGARRGVPKILELLRDEGLKATFFTPGWTVETHPEAVDAILSDGHEVGHHGYLHEWVDPAFPDKEEAAIDRGLEAWQKTFNVRPKGYRSPAGEMSANVLKLLAERDFTYDSSLMADVFPYWVQPDVSPRPLVELPWHWSIDDAVYSLFHIKSPRPFFTNEHILSLWLAEFREVYRWGALFNGLMHPQVIGRPARIALLRSLVHALKEFPHVHFGRCIDVAEAWAAAAPAPGATGTGSAATRPDGA